MGKRKRAFLLLAIACIIAIVLLIGLRTDRWAQIVSEHTKSIDTSLSAEENVQAQAKATGLALGPLSLIPPLVAIALAFITKEVISSLLAGVLVGYSMLFLLDGGSGFFPMLYGVASDTVHGVIDVASDPYNCSVILLCLIIGGLVAVIRISGGFRALANRLVQKVKSPRGAQLISQLMGVVIFFDDYANSLIVGPVMSPVTDKLRVSREKLAYIVDSTAAPVAGLAIISSWISAELAAIESGFVVANVTASAYGTFLSSIPYCFYNIFALIFLFSGILTRREYGRMLHAEVRARRGTPVKPGTRAEEDNVCLGRIEEISSAGKIWAAVVPIVALCGIAVVEFYFTGLQTALEKGLLSPDVSRFSLSTISTAFSEADTITILVKATIISSIIALVFGIATKAFSFVKGVETWVSGASAMFVTGIILCLAWCLSGVVAQLGTAYYLVELISLNLPAWCIPTLVFLVCCVISFAAGSYGCMLIVMPIAIPIAFGVTAQQQLTGAEASALLSACVASVLSGAIFGDHCSPITDTTILSSIGTGCNNIDHVKTQLPYALTVAGISAAIGTLPAGFGLPPWGSILAGAVCCVAVWFIFGKKPDSFPMEHL